ncbi:MAG TPA: hypothetical protein VFX12_12070 [Vicinamibacterales bacterium]|nr:hypothetical protein [Vicinamibacterales bacterium]
MSRRLSFITALCALAAAGACGSSPTGPNSPRAPALSLDRTTLVVPRHETGQIRAAFGMPGAQQDVTSAAAWTSSSPAIISVEAGLVTAKAIGTASVTAEYQGMRQMVTVTARRRTRLIGTIRVSDADGRQSMGSLHSYVDGQETGDDGTSHAQSSMSVTWGGGLGWIVDPVVDPGSHTVSVAVGVLNPPNVYTSDGSSHVAVTDIDTGESLATISLPVQSKSLADIRTDRITWTVEVQTYSS